VSPRERPGRPRTRLFLALELPEPARTALARWRDAALGGHDELRLVRFEYLHVTLVFLGWQYEREVDRIALTAFSALAGASACKLVPLGLMPVPKRGPRLFALDLEDRAGGAAAVQADAAAALASEGLYEPERRPFWPHVTLARVKRGKRPPRVDAPDPPPTSFSPSVVTLYRSVLQPQGARYEPLHHHALG
jgi:2'-5' RNA ligase